MALVTVYRFTKYDIFSDQKILSPSMATRETIKGCRGKVIEGTGIAIDDARLDGNGMVAVSESRSLR
jgi:hypothetical protein